MLNPKANVNLEFFHYPLEVSHLRFSFAITITTLEILHLFLCNNSALMTQ